MDFESIPEELKDRARGCKTPEDVLSLAKELDYKLSDEQLEGLSGGASWSCTADCNDHTPCSQNR